MEVAPASTLPLSVEELPGRSTREQGDLARPTGDCDRAEGAAADYPPPHLGPQPEKIRRAKVRARLSCGSSRSGDCFAPRPSPGTPFGEVVVEREPSANSGAGELSLVGDRPVNVFFRSSAAMTRK